MARVPRPLLLAAFWMTAIAVGILALLPATMPLPSTGWDKANHGLAFGVLAIEGLLCWPRNALRVLIVVAAFGGAIEIAQTFTETRDGDVFDWFADMVGMALAVALWWWALRMPARDGSGSGG